MKRKYLSRRKTIGGACTSFFKILRVHKLSAYEARREPPTDEKILGQNMRLT